MGSPKKDWLFCVSGQCIRSLTSESVEGTSLPLEGIDHIHGGDSLPLGMLSVGDSITNDILQEDLKTKTVKTLQLHTITFRTPLVSS